MRISRRVRSGPAPVIALAAALAVAFAGSAQASATTASTTAASTAAASTTAASTTKAASSNGAAQPANTSVCSKYCDGRDPAVAVGDRDAAVATVWSRSIELHISDPDDMAWASITNGSPTDEVWLDRSWDGGQTWSSGSKLGDTTIPSGDTGWRTLMYNIDNPSAGQTGVVRACGKAGNRTDIACTPWEKASIGSGTAADSAEALAAYWNPSTGLWDSGPYSWQDANALTTLTDYMRRSGNATYTSVISTTYNDNISSANFTDSYIDDTGWWGLAWLDAYEYTGNSTYLNVAEADANDMNQYWDNTCGGGVWWSTAKTYKNAIANELYLELNAELHNDISGDSTYLGRAQAEWTWFQGSGMINSSHLINDGLTTSTCANNGEATFSYNQGVILAGLGQLYKATGNSSLLTSAESIATAATTDLTTNGILVDPCEPNGCANDGFSFKGAFIRGLSDFQQLTGVSSYNTFLSAQAGSIESSDTNSVGQSGLAWAGPLANVNYPDTQSALDALNSQL